MKNTAMLRLALLQIAPGNTLQENLKKGEGLPCRQGPGGRPGSFSRNVEQRIPADGPAGAAMAAGGRAAPGGVCAGVRTLAAELEMAIGLTLLESYPGAPRNTLVLFDRFGREKPLCQGPHLRF